MSLGSHLITVRRLEKYINDVIGKKANLPNTNKTIIGNISQINSDLTQEVSRATSSDTNLQTQIDQLVAPSGTAPNPAEVENARIGSDGVTYTTLGDAIRTNDTVVYGMIERNILPQNKSAWGVLPLNYTEGQKIKYGTSSDFNFETTDGYYGFYSVPIPVNAGDVINCYGYAGYKYNLFALDENLICISASGFKNNDTRFSYTMPANSKYLIISISSASSTQMTIDNDLLNCLNSIRITSATVGDITDYKEFNGFKGANMMWQKQVETYNATRYTTPNYQPNPRRISQMYEVKPGHKYNYTVNDGYRLWMRDVDDDNLIVGDSGWITTSGTHRVPTNCKRFIVVIAKTNDTTFSMANVKDAGFSLIEDVDFTELDMSTDDANRILLDKNIISIDDFEQGTFSRDSSTHLFTEASSSTKLRSKKNLEIEADKIYKVSIDGSGDYACLLWGYNLETDDSLYTSWLFADSYIMLPVNMDTTIQIKKANDGAISVGDLANIKFNISTVEPSELENNFYESFWVMHRCGGGDAPENTLASLVKAHENGHKICETDVRFSSDGVPFCFHDATLDRMTDGTGNLSDMTATQLEALTVTGGNHASEYSNLKIPTLAQMLASARKLNMKLVLDGLSSSTKAEVESVVNLVLAYRMQDMVAIRTGVEVGRQIKYKYPNLNYIFISGSKSELTSEQVSEFLVYPSAVCGWSLYNAPNDYVDVIEMFHARKMPVGMYIYTESGTPQYTEDDYLGYEFDFMIVDSTEQTKVNV